MLHKIKFQWMNYWSSSPLCHCKQLVRLWILKTVKLKLSWTCCKVRNFRCLINHLCALIRSTFSLWKKRTSLCLKVLVSQTTAKKISFALFWIASKTIFLLQLLKQHKDKYGYNFIDNLIAINTSIPLSNRYCTFFHIKSNLLKTVLIAPNNIAYFTWSKMILN